MLRLLTTVCFILLFGFSNSFAAAGCCSHHGGVNGCNTATNHQLCKDGTSSPTCMCNGTTEAKPKKTTTKPAATTESASTAAAAPVASTTAAAPAASTTAEKKKTTKGCCAKHGGVASCNATTGYYACKDGTASATCKCS